MFVLSLLRDQFKGYKWPPFSLFEATVLSWSPRGLERGLVSPPVVSQRLEEKARASYLTMRGNHGHHQTESSGGGGATQSDTKAKHHWSSPEFQKSPTSPPKKLTGVESICFSRSILWHTKLTGRENVVHVLFGFSIRGKGVFAAVFSVTFYIQGACLFRPVSHFCSSQRGELGEAGGFLLILLLEPWGTVPGGGKSR